MSFDLSITSHPPGSLRTRLESSRAQSRRGKASFFGWCSNASAVAQIPRPWLPFKDALSPFTLLLNNTTFAARTPKLSAASSVVVVSSLPSRFLLYLHAPRKPSLHETGLECSMAAACQILTEGFSFDSDSGWCGPPPMQRQHNIIMYVRTSVRRG
jgi:hypothetical protein